MRNLVLALILVLLAADIAVAQPVLQREYDGLLESDPLRALVEAQSRRDAASLISALDSEDAPVRARAALALASVQDDTALRPLISRLADPDPRVRADVAFALGQLRDSTAARPLLDALHRERDAEVLHFLHDAIGEIAGHSAARAYLDFNATPEFAWRHALGLARIGMRDVRRAEVGARLTAYLFSHDAESRRHAAYYFWRVNDVGSWEEVASHVRSALSQLSNDDVAAGYLALALGGTGDPSDLDRLLQIAAQSQDWRTRDRALRSASRYESERATLALVGLLDDPSHHVAETAARLVADRSALPIEAIRIIQNRVADEALSIRIRGHLARSLARHGDDEHALILSESSPVDAAPALGVSESEESFRRLLSMIRSNDIPVGSAALAALRSRWSRDRARTDLHSTYVDAMTDALSGGDVAMLYGGAPLLSDSIFVSAGSPRLMRSLFESFEMPRDVEAAVAIVQAAQIIDHPDARELLADARRHEHPAVRRAAGVQSGSSGPELAGPDWALLTEIGPRPILDMMTERGTVSMQLFSDLAPATVSTIVRLARDGRYDGVPFHRVVSDFVIQGGDFARGDGFGGPGFEIPSEFTSLRYATGTVGMASAGKDTEGSQFFITHSMQPHLDGRYTAFGVVIEGQEVVDAVERGDRILSISLREREND
jgi:cyclophilin family peptidyl-prolyl cis-trans isomerase/HEAT repeat protein